MKDYSSFPIFDCEMGSTLLYKMDPSCVTYHDRFLSRYNGKLFIKDALQQKAKAYQQSGERRKASRCLERG